MKNQMKNHRKQLAVGALSLALLGGVAGTAYAASSVMPGRGNGQHMAGGAMNGQHLGSAMMGNTATMPIAAAADYLGLTQADLQVRLRAGTSLTAIATAQGKSVAGLTTALTKAMTARINAAPNLTADQKAAMLALVPSHVATMLTTTDHQPGNGMGQGMGAGMGAGMGPGRGHMGNGMPQGRMGAA